MPAAVFLRGKYGQHLPFFSNLEDIATFVCVLYKFGWFQRDDKYLIIEKYV